MENHSCVQFDAYSGMRQLVEHFIQKHNSKKIAFIRGPEFHASAVERYNAYFDVLKDNNLWHRNSDELVSSCFSWGNGISGIKQLCEERGLVPGKDFDSLIVSSDLMAREVVLYLQKKGFSIPKDITIGGFNASAEPRLFSDIG